MSGAVSVALCTHNGERHLRAQLDSISGQELSPAELVACDDVSTDGTIEILEAFAREAPFPVRVTRNAERLGPAKNYEQAIGLCGGDFIALADQDDVWLPGKLQRLMEAIERGGAAYAFSDARLIDADGHDVPGKTLLARRFSPASIDRAFRAHREQDLLLKRDFIYGTTLLLRSEHRDLVLPIAQGWSHDPWIVNVLALLGYGGAAVPEPLVLYRQHAVQASGGFAAPTPVSYPERVLAYEALRTHLHAVSARTGRPAPPGAMSRVDDKMRYLRALVEMEVARQPRKALMGAREIIAGRWRRYSPRTFG